MRRGKRATIGFSVVTLLWVSVSGSRAQQQEIAAAGKVPYQQYCAACHGLNGKGNGNMAKLRKVKPANLTQLSAKNWGVFPFWRVYRIVDGREEVPGSSLACPPLPPHHRRPGSLAPNFGDHGPSDSALAAASGWRLRRPTADRHAARCASRDLCSGARHSAPCALGGHGSRDMPIWGMEFKRQAGADPAAELQAHARIIEIVYYIRLYAE